MGSHMNLPAIDDAAAHMHGDFMGSWGSNAAAPGTHGFGPGPSSPEAAASELAQLCSVIRRDFLTSLQLPDESTGGLELQAALCRWALPAQTHEPPAAPDSTAASTQEPVPEPQVPDRHRSTPTSPAAPPSQPAGGSSHGQVWTSGASSPSQAMDRGWHAAPWKAWPAWRGTQAGTRCM